jgi:hypothetical protein
MQRGDYLAAAAMCRGFSNFLPEKAVDHDNESPDTRA